MKHTSELTAADFVTPAGVVIETTCEIIPGTCGIIADEEGWDHDGNGTNVDWNCQDQEKDAKGREIWLGNDGQRYVWNGIGWEAPAEDDRDARIARLEAEKAALIQTLENISEGSRPTGRWLAPDGSALDDQNDEDDPPLDDDGNPDPECEWEPYSESEQRDWLESVADMADAAIAVAKGGPLPADPVKARLLAALNAIVTAGGRYDNGEFHIATAEDGGPEDDPIEAAESLIKELEG